MELLPPAKLNFGVFGIGLFRGSKLAFLQWQL
jgi:hypothetical protein